MLHTREETIRTFTINLSFKAYNVALFVEPLIHESFKDPKLMHLRILKDIIYDA